MGARLLLKPRFGLIFPSSNSIMKAIIILTAAFFVTGCISCRKQLRPDAAYDPGISQKEMQKEIVFAPEVMNSQPRNIVLKASAFRMSGNYANNVAVTLDSSGRLTYFPAPSDISAVSAPLEIGNGWWLNRQGIGPGSVFTRYTFSEYAALPAPPSPQEIKEAIIPGAVVTEFRTLPISASDAAKLPPSDLLYYL